MLDKIKIILYILFNGGINDMVAVYLALVMYGRYTFSQVPDILKDRVKTELEILGLGDLATE